MLKKVNNRTLCLGRSFRRDPVTQSLHSMLLENTVGVVAETLDQVLEPTLVCMIDPQLVKRAFE